MTSSAKRKASLDDSKTAQQKSKKAKKQWRTPLQGRGGVRETHTTIEAGDVGIFVTCDMNKEAKSVTEVKDMFEEYAEKLYPSISYSSPGESQAHVGTDIAKEIENELHSMKQAEDARFKSVRLDTPCVLFFKVKPPIEPVSFIHTICVDAAEHKKQRRCRFVRRLTPVKLVGKATENGIAEVAREVLAPHFHEPNGPSRKTTADLTQLFSKYGTRTKTKTERCQFAIRPTIRNHHIMTRGEVIDQVASIVGPGHRVDLKEYDLLILVDILKNICGMSVVGRDFDRLKRYNLFDLQDLRGGERPSPEHVASTAPTQTERKPSQSERDIL